MVWLRYRFRCRFFLRRKWCSASAASSTTDPRCRSRTCRIAYWRTPGMSPSIFITGSVVSSSYVCSSPIAGSCWAKLPLNLVSLEVLWQFYVQLLFFAFRLREGMTRVYFVIKLREQKCHVLLQIVKYFELGVCCHILN